jgi:hypothetical protein
VTQLACVRDHPVTWTSPPSATPFAAIRPWRRATQPSSAPAGQEEFFTLVGQPVATRTQAPPPLDGGEHAAFLAKAQELAPKYKTDLLPPPSAK